MTRWPRYVGPLAALALAAGALSIATAPAAIAQRAYSGLTAFIVNDTQSPVPAMIVNGPTNPVKVIDGGGVPFHRTASLLPTVNLAFGVPENTRVLIRYVSGTCSAQDGARARWVQLETGIINPGDADVRHTFPLVGIGASEWVFAQDTFIHATGGVLAAVAASPALGHVTCNLTVSGELFPME